MKKCATWMLLACAPLLAACQTSVPASVCDGLKKPPKANDAAALVQREEAIARYLVSTDVFGRGQGCWK